MQFLPTICVTWEEPYIAALYTFLPVLLDYTLIVAGSVDTVELISPDPISNPIPNCKKNLGSFLLTLDKAVGTTFGKM